MSSISWLENHTFLVGHTPSTFSQGPPAASTIFHIVTRQTQSQVSFVFQKLPEVCPNYNTTRLPPHTFLQRLREFPPSLRDLIVVVSTGAPDVGLISRSKVPLTNAFPHDKVTDVFTTTTVANDARRAQLPITTDFIETTAIGVALDLSAQENVTRPLPGEEIEESHGPLPGVMVLNNEGVLSFWWIVYADSIRQGTTYPGLVLGTRQEQGQSQAGQLRSNINAVANPFGGVSALSGTVASPFDKPATPATWATSTAGSSGFGTTSGLGKQPSPWGANASTSTATQSASSAFGQPAFGQPGGFSQPAFGTTSALGSQGAAFGMAGTIGNRASPWATSSGTSGGAFGQAGVPGIGSGNTSATAPANSPFGSSRTGGFAEFAKAPGFSAAAAQGRLDSGFGGSPGVPFSSGIESDMSFSGITKPEDSSSSLFKDNTFILGSTFKGDGTAANDLPKPPTASNSLFGTNIDEGLGATRKGALTPPSQEAEMDDDIGDGDKSSPLSSIERESVTPAENPDIAKSPSGVAPSSHEGYFGVEAESSVTPASGEASAPVVSTSDTDDGTTPITTTPKETPRKPEISRIPNETTPTPQIKSEFEETEHTALTELSAKNAEPSLPPEPTSKASYTPGDTSSSSIDTPLPQESVPLRKQKTIAKESPQNGGDGGDVSEDDEGSGVDVAEEISPTSDPNQSPRETPGSSFGAGFDKSPLGGLFTKVSQHQNQLSKPLFGEVGQTSIPYFRQPIKEPESPRSPSPVRPIFPGDRQRPENARSFTAPSQPAKVTAYRTNTLSPALAESSTRASLEAERELRDQFRAKKAQQAAEEEQELSDREDEKVREELATEVEPTKDLAPFLAHQDYVGGVNKPGVAGQIETVYRDINSMLDTLGLNARSLKAFVDGHSKFFQRGGRERNDLETEDWCLVEIWELNKVEEQLMAQLEKGRVRSVQEKLDTCRDYRTALKKVRSKRHEIARVVDAKSNPEQIEAKKTAALDSDQSHRQHELRKKFSEFQKLLAKAEENISLLRANLVSFETRNGKSTPLRKPTVEAVTSTIKKMTSMVEKKTIDINLLEAEMRRLCSSSVNGSDGREQSPFTSSLRSSKLNTPPSKTSGEPQTPRSSGSNLRKSLGESGTPGKRLSKITNEDITRYRTKVQRRSEINAVIKKALLDSGPRLRSLD